MRINQEKFEELSQLDRIEFCQRVDRIERKTNVSILTCCIIVAWLYVILAFLLDIWMIVKTGESAMNFVGVFMLVIVLLGIGIIFDLGIYYLRIQSLTKLEEKFFEIKPKAKKK